MRLGSGQPHHRQFRGNHLHATAQIGYGLNESTLTGIYDDNVVRFRQGSNGRLNFPPVRLARAPRVIGKYSHTLPHHQLMVHRLTLDTAEGRVDLAEPQARLSFYTKQQVKASGHEISVYENAAVFTSRQCPCKHGSHDAQPHASMT